MQAQALCPDAVCIKEQEKKRILFVCTGNTCRSPMAAALLNDMARGRGICSVSTGSTQDPCPLVATSAGLYAVEGAPITAHAARALAEAGVVPTPDNDYPHHLARGVTEEMMAGAHEVVAITASHAMDLMMRFPRHAGKIVTLGTDIPDPFGGDMNAYRDCLSMLSFGILMRYFAAGDEA